MIRYRPYENSQTRLPTSLDGWWDFAVDPDKKGDERGYYADFPSQSRPMWVPSVWNSVHSLFGYEGDTWYRREFRTYETYSLKINFGAVMLHASVWLDGDYLGEHDGGFTPFYFVKRHCEPGDHTLVVKVNNDYNNRTLPKDCVDWYPYGGIYRTAYTEQVPDIFIDRLQVGYHTAAGELAVRLFVHNLSGESGREKLVLEIDGTCRTDIAVEVAGATQQTIDVALPIGDCALWEPENPVLHTISVKTDYDHYTDRFGIRDIAIRGADILLNGKKVFLKGINRHDDHPDWGFAIPPHLIRQDLEMIKDAGFNSIRGSHYPQNEAVLDICDELGLIYIGEVPSWQYSVEQLTEEPSRSRMFQMLEEMIRRDYNHPCVLAWSVTNESCTDLEESREIIRDLAEAAENLDQTRPVTFATAHLLRDRCFDLVDIACINEYMGWYEQDANWADCSLDELLIRLSDYIGEKPMLVTEFGAGAIAGTRSLDYEKWTEECQARLLAEQIRSFVRSGVVAGFFVWQFCDTRAHPDMALSRPRLFNNKGIVTEYRRPKMAYWELKRLLTDLD